MTRSAFSARIRPDHTAEIWRDTETEDEYGSTTELVQQNAPTAHNCRPDRAWTGDMQRHGGDRMATNRVWYLHPDLDVRTGDVLNITAGVESPASWRVLTSVPQPDHRGDVSHIEANCETHTAPLGAA